MHDQADDEAPRKLLQDRLKGDQRMQDRIASSTPATSRIIGLPESVGYRGNVSTESLAVIEAPVCHASDSLATSRSRRLFSEIMQLRSALSEVTSLMEAVARSSFAGSAETFEADWRAQDPEGHAAWSRVRSVLGDRS